MAPADAIIADLGWIANCNFDHLWGWNGGNSVCRKNQLLGVALMAFGLGLLLATFFESGLFCGCLGFGVAAVGIVVLQKR